jgi:hypothetical protein
VDFGYRNYFAKIFLIYGVGWEWDLGEMDEVERREFLKDLVDMARGHDARVGDVGVVRKGKVGL